MKHHMNAVNICTGESRIFLFLRYALSAMIQQIIIHFLYLPAGQLVKLYIAETRDDVFCNIPVVVIRSALTYVRLRIYLKPQRCPFCDRVGLAF